MGDSGQPSQRYAEVHLPAGGRLCRLSALFPSPQAGDRDQPRATRGTWVPTFPSGPGRPVELVKTQVWSWGLLGNFVFSFHGGQTWLAQFPAPSPFFLPGIHPALQQLLAASQKQAGGGGKVGDTRGSPGLGRRHPTANPAFRVLLLGEIQVPAVEVAPRSPKSPPFSVGAQLDYSSHLPLQLGVAQGRVPLPGRPLDLRCLSCLCLLCLLGVHVTLGGGGKGGAPGGVGAAGSRMTGGSSVPSVREHLP